MLRLRIKKADDPYLYKIFTRNDQYGYWYYYKKDKDQYFFIHSNDLTFLKAKIFNKDVLKNIKEYHFNSKVIIGTYLRNKTWAIVK